MGVSTETASFIRRLPKAELHMHLEGSLEPELLMHLSQRNGVTIPYASVEAIRAAYAFSDLQSFLDIYYQGMSVLRHSEDFCDLTAAYLERAAADGVVHVEVFFDPQAHTARDIALDTVVNGIVSGLSAGQTRHGITYRLIPCILRHLPEADGLATLDALGPFIDAGLIDGIGLDSSEQGHPPANFERLYSAARERGLKLVAHAGEEGPPAYVEEALDVLHIDRIDHGNRAMESAALVQRLAELAITLTVCPLSNLRLCGIANMRDHPLKAMLDAGLKATVNSDDPAYFGGYVVDNYVAVTDALGLSRQDLVTLARNSISGAFLGDEEKAPHLVALDAIAAVSLD